MLKRVKNQENVIMIFFVVTLVFVGIYAFLGKAVIDVIYFGVLFYYFCRFLKLKNNGK